MLQVTNDTIFVIRKYDKTLGCICVKTLFTEASLSCFKLKGSCKVGGEVCLTILFNLFGEKRKGTESAHICTVATFKKTIDFFCIFFYYYWEKKVKTDIWGKKRTRAPVARTLGEILLVSPAVLSHRKSLGWSPSGVREVPLGELPGALWRWATAAAAGRGGDEIIAWKGEKSRESGGMKTPSFVFIPLIFSGITPLQGDESHPL